MLGVHILGVLRSSILDVVCPLTLPFPAVAFVCGVLSFVGGMHVRTAHPAKRAPAA